MHDSDIRSHLKNKILVQDQGGAEVQPAGILQVFRGVETRTQQEIGPKNFFEMASSLL
jgi:hypothetical protein